MAKPTPKPKNAAAFEYNIVDMPPHVEGQSAVIASMARDSWRLIAVNSHGELQNGQIDAPALGYFERRITPKVPADITLLEQTYRWLERASADPGGDEFLNDKGWNQGFALKRRIKTRLDQAGVL